MTDKECKFLHTAPCRKYMENPDRGCKAQCKSYHPELCKYSRVRWECCNVRCFRIHLKATRCKQTPPATRKPSTTPRTTNQQHFMIAIQNLAYNRSPHLSTLPAEHATATHPAPLTTHYHPPPLCIISPPITLPFLCTPILTTPCQPLHNQLILNSSIHSSASNI